MQRCELHKIANSARIDVVALQVDAEIDADKVVYVPEVQRDQVGETNEGEEHKRCVLSQLAANVERYQVTNCAKYVEPEAVDGENVYYIDHVVSDLFLFLQNIDESWEFNDFFHWIRW